LDRGEVAPAIELLLVHPLSVLGVAALVWLVHRGMLVSGPLPKATALGGSMLGMRTMGSASARSCVDADALCGL